MKFNTNKIQYHQKIIIPKAIPVQGQRVPGIKEYTISWHSTKERVTFVSPTQRQHLHTSRYPCYQFRYRLSRTQGHSVDRRILLMNITNLYRSASRNCGTACPLLSILCYQILFCPVLHQVWIIIKNFLFCFQCGELIPVQILSLNYEKYSYWI